MRACVIVPARYKSSRLPGKPLVKLLGKPMIIWVAELSAKAVGKDNVFIATDDYRISEVIEKAGYKYILTSESALTGTDRVAEAALQLDYDIYINVQGDEPLLCPEDIQKCIQYKQRYPQYIVNSYNKILPSQKPSNKNIPKVIVNESDLLIYISRSLIPGSKESTSNPIEYKKQVCIYGYNMHELSKFRAFGRKSKLELIEDIEILRFFELGHSVKMFSSCNESLAVDVRDDIIEVEKELKLLAR